MKESAYSIYKSKPQLILGQIESFSALILWFNESYSKLSEIQKRDIVLFNPNFFFFDKNIPLNVKRKKQVILDSIILYGNLDVSSGSHLYRFFLGKNGIGENNGEIYHEYFKIKKDPFANYLDKTFLTQSKLNYYSYDINSNEICKSIINYLKFAKFDVTENFRKHLKEIVDSRTYNSELINKINSDNYVEIITKMIDDIRISTNPYLEPVLISFFELWDKSIDDDIPLFSNQFSAPYFIKNEKETLKYQTIKLIHKEVKWFPKPKTFHEAMLMSEDDKIVSFRNYINLLEHKYSVGDLDDIDDIKNEIHKCTIKFKNKSWSSNIAKYVTYLSLPVAIYEILNAKLELGLISVGFLAQGIADIIDRSKTKSWLSMDQDFLTRKD